MSRSGACTNKPEKPNVGSWTALYPELGKADVSLEDCVSQEYYDKEKEAIFKRTWLNVGRAEDLPSVGSYFTKELAACDTSIVVVRGADKKIRAFHNVCSHRGQKLVWDDEPRNEARGVCRKFQCKYHGWEYGLDGALQTITREEEFFTSDKRKYGLSPVSCDVWEGFIFVNMEANPRQTLKEFLGEMGEGLAGYPFHKMTHCYTLRGVLNANWKALSDSFAETYHAPFLHGRMSTEMASDIATSDGTLFKIMPPHGVVSWREFPRDQQQPTPIEPITRAGLFGPWEQPDLPELKNLPKGVNEIRDNQWGLDSNQIFPNFVIIVWERGWYMSYNYWPLAVDKVLFEMKKYFVPPKNASERVAQEMSCAMLREYIYQDACALEAEQIALNTRVKLNFPLNDQEVLLRNLHYRVAQEIKAYEAKRAIKAVK